MSAQMSAQMSGAARPTYPQLASGIGCGGWEESTGASSSCLQVGLRKCIHPSRRHERHAEMGRAKGGGAMHPKRWATWRSCHRRSSSRCTQLVTSRSIAGWANCGRRAARGLSGAARRVLPHHVYRAPRWQLDSGTARLLDATQRQRSPACSIIHLSLVRSPLPDCRLECACGLSCPTVG